jgi:transposase
MRKKRGSAMKDPLKLDGRTIPGPVMDYLRKIAVRAVEEKGYSPEVVMDLLGLSRSGIYTWLRRYSAEGQKGLETRSAPGAWPVITPPMEPWLRETVWHSTPVDHGYDTVLWTREILAELLGLRFGVQVSGRTVSLHLNQIGLSYQKPSYRATEQNPKEVEHFLQVKFPVIQRQAQKLGADIAFEDEGGVNLQTHAGRTWGERGQTPLVPRTDARGGFNILSIVEASGHLHYHIEAGNINSQRYIAFLRQLLQGRTRPLILLVDRASFHGSKKVRDFVRAHRRQLRIFFLPRHAPERNPDEHVWEEIKDKQIGRQPVKNQSDLKKRLHSALKSLQHRTKRILSFFQLPETQYAAA